MQYLQVIEHNNQRILTTRQLADGYGTTAQKITNNFNNNKKHYTEGKHFYLLEKDEMRAFAQSTKIELTNANKKLYLWTERGALFHAKSLNTPKAWEVYENLVDNYFRGELQAQQELPQPPQPTPLETKLERLIGLLEQQFTPPIPIQPEPFALPPVQMEPLAIAEFPQFPQTAFNINDLKKKTLLNRRESAFYIGVCATTMDNIIRSGNFPATVRIGRRVFINREKLDQWINEQDGSRKGVCANG